MFSRQVFRFAVLAALFALTLTAQTGSGRVQGTVKDSSGASIPGATVTLVNTATMVESSTKTNDVGLFVFPPVVTGNYTLTAQSPGMETWKGAFLLPVGQTVEISPVLKVGAVTTQVTVAGDVAPLVPTSDSTLSTDLEHARIEQLPMDFRNLAILAVLDSPGLFQGQDSGEINQGPSNPIVYGLRDGVELYQDGAAVKNRDTGDWAGRLPGVDSVGEMQVQTSLSSAQFDRPGSVILSTKSGTNGIHGSLFETNRNSGVGVARARTDFYTKPPHLVRNEFGGSVGGPVYLPKIYNGKNKTFFFTSYELLRLGQASTTSTTVPTLAQRNGDYSGASDGLPLVNSIGQLTVLYDPNSTGPAPTWTRTPFPNNKMPATSEGPIAKYLYNIEPAPTNNANPNIGTNYFGLNNNPYRDSMSTTRIDHRMSDRDQVFVRVSDNRTIQESHSTVPSTNDLMNTGIGTDHNTSFAGTWTHSFSPAFLSTTQVSFYHEHKTNNYPGVPGISNLSDYLNIPNVANNPNIAFSASGMGFGLNLQQSNGRWNNDNIILWNEDFTRMYGRHQLQFGGRLHIELLQSLTDQPYATASFGSLYTGLYNPASGSAYSALPLTGFNGASFFLGDADSYSDGVVRPLFKLRDNEYAGYFQDNWKATSRLTLNFGLRYEDMPAESTAGNEMVGFDKNTDSMVLGASLQNMYLAGMTTPTVIGQLQAIGAKFETAQQAGLPSGLLYGNPWIFEPRMGFAYRLGDNVKPMMLRGGWGLYDSQTGLRVWDNTVAGSVPYGYNVAYSVNNAALAGVAPGLDGLPNYELRSAPQYTAGIGTSTVLNNPALVKFTPGCCGFSYLDPHRRPTRSAEWNFSIGREVLPGIVATASYVGTHGWNLPQLYSFNAAPNSYIWYTTTGLPLATGTYASTAQNAYDKTTWGTMQQFITNGFSNDSSATFELQRRFSHGYGFEFSYVLSDAFEDSNRVANGGGPTFTPASTYLPGAVPTDFNAMDRFLNYVRDTMIPHHQLKWNWVVDVPFGRGELLASHAGKILNGIIGGWQLAGTGNYQSRYWTLPSTNYGPMTQPIMYGVKQFPIQNCTSGVSTCVPGYLDWNGYISPPTINRVNAAGQCTGICGIPSIYSPSNLPLVLYGQTALPANAPASTNLSTYWETQEVWIKLANGTVVPVAMNTNLPAWRQQYEPAPWVFGLNASLFKVFNVTESVKLRFNADFFQVLNNPGLAAPGSNGILSVQSSYNSPRDLQLTLRLTW
ncbi:MAG: carboxypeptidase regulatory-like domain-containing protein [Bryobacteraceae bacterium]|jgi:hypothetical protein